MRIFTFNKRYCFIVCFFHIIMGAYCTIVNSEYVKLSDFNESFITIRDGNTNNIGDGELDFTTILIKVIMISISILLCSFYTKNNYKTKSIYCATRYGSFKSFFFHETLSLMVLIILSQLVFYISIVFACYREFHSDSLSFVTIAYINSVIIVFLFSFLISVIALIINQKFSLLIIMSSFFLLSSAIPISPPFLTQYNIVAWYFTNDFINEKNIFHYPICTYYISFAFIITLLYFFFQKVLSEKPNL